MSSRRPRYPRYGRFVGVGVVLGIVLAAVAALTSAPSRQYTDMQAFGYLAVLFAMVGGVLGAGVAVAIESRRGRDRSASP